MTFTNKWRACLLVSAATGLAPVLTGQAQAQSHFEADQALRAATADAAALAGSETRKDAQLLGEQMNGPRLVPLSGGIIRPFAGGIFPYAGTIRTFAGPISGSAGTIRSFSGDSMASAGTIRSFAGTIRSFAGTIRSFQTTVIPATGPDPLFWGGIYPASGTLTASAGTIRSFSGQFEGMAGTIRSFAGTIRSFDGTLATWQSGAAKYEGLATQIATLVEQTKASWGGAVTKQTGKTFEAGFSDRMLAKYGIDLKNAQSLVGMDEVGVEMFLMDWYDNLMNFSGADQVDHWMAAVNWTPRITQDLGSGKDSKIGLLDFTVTGEGTSSLVKVGGVSTVAGIHGSAVLSLMTAAHDGRGVMGIAPGAAVVSYNPFDTSYTAGWTDIRNGVINLVKNGATIINMSLGVPGWTLNPGWNDVFSDDAVSKEAKKRVFVLAAGNDGIIQTQNVQWAFDKNPAVIVVGSVDPTGIISQFSNQPGSVCLTQDGKMAKDGTCTGAGRADLMSRFIVAPGEFILVADGQGGVTRMSGTSFAAPLVSGTIALIHDRWPWLRDRPADTAELILSSARDVGAPGTDPVYGRGMLDVAAALSPKSLDALNFKMSVNGGAPTSVKAQMLTPDQRQSMISYWEANNAYVVGFDDTLTSYRDFAVPLSTKLAGQTVGNSTERFNTYLTSRFYDWFSGGGTIVTDGKAPTGKLAAAFGADRFTSQMAAPAGFEATMSASPKIYRPGFRQSGVTYETNFALHNLEHGYGFRFGTGRSGAALGARGFKMQSDYEVAAGGANPFLGFASGAGYAALEFAIAPGLRVTSGVARQEAVRDLRNGGLQDHLNLGALKPYSATANTMTLEYNVGDSLTTTLGYTLLDEGSGLLGTQSLDKRDFAHGSKTDAGTAAIELRLSSTMSISGSTTWGRTRAGNASAQGIVVSSGGLLSSAYQGAFTKVGLFGDDRVRLTLSQPLHLERGAINLNNVQVIDRQTGQLGTVVQTFQIQGRERRFLAEMLYGRSLMDGRADLNLFGKTSVAGTLESGEAALTLGSSFTLRFN